MLKEGHHPNFITFIALIDGFAKKTSWTRAHTSSMKCPTKIYIPMLSQTMCLFMVYVRKKIEG
jgi:hypothetical protein